MIIEYAYSFNTCGQVTCLSKMQGGPHAALFPFKGQIELRQPIDRSVLCPNDCKIYLSEFRWSIIIGNRFMSNF